MKKITEPQDAITDKITCIMLTRNEVRRPFVQMAIRCFQRQTYAHKELLIINSGKEPIGCTDDRVREIMSTAPTLGHLRNIGLDNVKDGFAIHWDDDDWRHEEYLSALWNESGRTIPRKQTKLLNVDFETGDAYIGPAFSVMLYHTSSVHSRYPEWNNYEDTAFRDQFPSIEEVDIPEHYYLRFYHGDNICSRDHILSGWRKTEEYREQIEDVIKEIRGYETNNVCS